MPDSFDDFCSLWPEYRMRGMHLPTSHFKNVFDVPYAILHNFEPFPLQ